MNNNTLIIIPYSNQLEQITSYQLSELFHSYPDIYVYILYKTEDSCNLNKFLENYKKYNIACCNVDDYFLTCFINNNIIPDKSTNIMDYCPIILPLFAATHSTLSFKTAIYVSPYVIGLDDIDEYLNYEFCNDTPCLIACHNEDSLFSIKCTTAVTTKLYSNKTLNYTEHSDELFKDFKSDSMISKIFVFNLNVLKELSLKSTDSLIDSIRDIVKFQHINNISYAPYMLLTMFFPHVYTSFRYNKFPSVEKGINYITPLDDITDYIHKTNIIPYILSEKIINNYISDEFTPGNSSTEISGNILLNNDLSSNTKVKKSKQSKKKNKPRRAVF